MNSKLISVLIAAVGLLAAFWLGASVANSDWQNLVFVLAASLILIFVCGGYRFAFHITTLLVSMGGSFVIGFSIGRDEQFLVISGALFAATFWRARENVPIPRELRHWSFRAVKTCMIFWIIYVILHMAIHLVLFPSPGLQNVIKSYNATLTPYIFALYFFCRPEMFPLPKNYLKVFCWIFASATFLSFLMRAYQTYYGSALVTNDPNEIGMAGPLVISFLRYTENLYALRSLGPASSLLGIILFTSHSSIIRSGFWRLFGFGLIGLGLLASLYSGGRASILLSLAFCGIILFVRNRRAPIAIGVAFIVLLIAFANGFSHWINAYAPVQVSRSAQLILIEKDDYSNRTITGSSDWRWGLAKYAFKKWHETPKTTLIGIGFQGFTASDIAAASFMGGMSEEFMWEMGVKRVATHNFVTDILVSYGIIGAIIYYLMLLFLLALTLRIFRSTQKDSLHKDFALFVFAHVWVIAILGNVAGSFLPINDILYLIIIVCALHQYNEGRAAVESAEPNDVGQLARPRFGRGNFDASFKGKTAYPG